MLKDPVVSVLGEDPNRVHRINANSFQQNAITTIKGWQYAAFYTDEIKGEQKDGCSVNLARRQILPSGTLETRGAWHTFLFEDYKQTVDDGHNTISIGICKGDGTIHVAFDHHCDQLRFRISGLGLADAPSTHIWDASEFTATQNFLPGIPANHLMKEVTYPRFVNIDDDLLLTYRIGQAGLGSDILYRYSSTTHQYVYLGQYLTGISNSPYINGLDYQHSRIHVSWCYRNFIQFPASASSEAHKQQAGPNGPENNYDLNYAFSEDKGETWKSSDGSILAKVGSKEERGVETTIKPCADGARVFEIPMHSGILNQEGQAVDLEGGFWALNREKVEGEQKWIAYYRDVAGHWTKKIVPSLSQPTETGSRGSICIDKQGSVYLVLPGNSDSSLDIMQARKDEEYGTFKSIWRNEGFNGEPLVDVQRLKVSDILSVFTRTNRSISGESKVVVLDFTLPDAVG